MDKEMPTAKVAAKLLINYEKQGGSDYFFINKATAEGDSEGKKGDNPPATRYNGGADEEENRGKESQMSGLEVNNGSEMGQLNSTKEQKKAAIMS